MEILSYSHGYEFYARSSYNTHTTPLRTWLGVLYFYLFPLCNRAVRVGIWVTLVAAVTLYRGCPTPDHSLYCIVKHSLALWILTMLIWWVNRDNHQGIINKLCCVGVRGSVLFILTLFQLNQSQHVMVDGCRSKLVNVVSGVAKGRI